MISTLPRWFGRKKSKDEKVKPQLEISQPFAPVHREGLSDLGQSMTSLVEQEAESLYVNGAVPAGQFKEYFMAPEEHKFLVPFPPREKSSLQGSVRSLLPQVSKTIVKRTESIRSALSVKRSPRTDNDSFVRQGSGRDSLMRKSVSVDNVLDESCKTLISSDCDNEYYNLTYLGQRTRAASQHVLNRENLEQHDQITLSTSYLGHTLLTAIGQDLESEASTDRDSGAVSLGGGWRLEHSLLYFPDSSSIDMMIMIIIMTMMMMMRRRRRRGLRMMRMRMMVRMMMVLTMVRMMMIMTMMRMRMRMRMTMMMMTMMK